MADDLLTFDLTIANKRQKDAAEGLRALGKSVENLDKVLGPVVNKELHRFLSNVVAALVKRHGNPYPGGTGAMSLSRRSGELIQSLQNNVFVKGADLNNLVGEIGGVFYAKVHEEGAIITPRKAKYLAIPLPGALNANGTPKKAGPRDWANTFVLESKKGNLLIVQRNGRQLTPLYVLKSSVRIPPRLNLRKTFETGIPPWVDEMSDVLLKAVLGELTP